MNSNDLSRREVMKATAATAVVPLVAEVAAGSSMLVGDYLMARLKEQGVNFLFGVPGATCDAVFEAAQKAKLGIITTSTDMEAAYAADGCARVQGLAAVSVTYGVGMMALLPVVAGAFAERSPVVILNGGPSAEDLRLQSEVGTLFSHSTGKPHSDWRMFEEVTAFARRIERVSEVATTVDEALRAAKLKQRPVYLEIAKDMWRTLVSPPEKPLLTDLAPHGNEASVAKDIIAILRSAKIPAVLVGIEIARYGLQDEVKKLLEVWGIPFATTLLSKSVLDENMPGFVGVYGGERALALPKKTIEDADALLCLGEVLGRQHRKLAQNKRSLVRVHDGLVSMANQKTPAAVSLPALLKELLAQSSQGPAIGTGNLVNVGALSFAERRAALSSVVRGDEPGLTYDEVLRVVSDALTDDVVVVTDTSLSMYPAAELRVRGRASFVCNAVWQSIGFSVAAAVGVTLGQRRRSLVICGDGGFQMTAQALSTLARFNLNSTILILDNGTYGIEQWLLQPSYFSSATPSAKPKAYLKLARWKYELLAQSMGIAQTAAVESVAAFTPALEKALKSKGPNVIAVRIQEHNAPLGLT
jgi:indolepyruvate decarboxylase